MYRLETNTGTVFPDSDNDGPTNPVELLYGTDPNNPDTDGDSVNNGDEVAAGTDPTFPDVMDSDGDGIADAADEYPDSDTAMSRLVAHCTSTLVMSWQMPSSLQGACWLTFCSPMATGIERPADE